MGNWNDGGLPYGARKVKFYTPGAADASGNTAWTAAKGIYILESLSPKRGQTVLKRYDEVRLPNAAAGIDDFVEGPAVVQLPYAASVKIDTGDAFTSLRQTGASESWVVTSVDEPEAQGEIKKQSITIQKLVGSASGNWPAVYP